MTTIYDQLIHERYDHHNTREAPMTNLATIEADVRNAITDVIDHGEQLVERAKTIIDEHLPAVASEAQRLEASPIFQALEGVFLAPEDEQMIAGLITKLAAYAAEHEQPQPGTQEPVSEPLPVAAGPVVGGQA